jgi:hypothetical protein
VTDPPRAVALDRLSGYKSRLALNFTPEVTKAHLVRAGCLLAAYEIIKMDVINGVAGFFRLGDNPNHTNYQSDVLSRVPKSNFLSSCDWLIEMEALTPEQVKSLTLIRDHRNEIAHEMPRLIVDPAFEIRIDLLAAAIDVISALGVFWGRIALESDEIWDGQDVKDEDIKSGSRLLMEYLLSVMSETPSVVNTGYA